MRVCVLWRCGSKYSYLINSMRETWGIQVCRRVAATVLYWMQVMHAVLQKHLARSYLFILSLKSSRC